jgi:hypothetical protein
MAEGAGNAGRGWGTHDRTDAGVKRGSHISIMSQKHLFYEHQCDKW